METDLKYRAPGKPRKNDGPPTIEEAQPVVIASMVPALICPNCRRGMQPRVLRINRGRDDGSRDCACSLCGKAFTYTPPRISMREG